MGGADPARLSDLDGRRVLIWGYGRHGGGLAAARFCAARGAQVSVLERKAPEDLGEGGAEALRQNWTWHIGDAGHEAFMRAELVVASPAIPPRAWPLRPPPSTCPEGLFFAAHRGPRLAVTGTKGKSTTAHLCAALLGWPVAGNSNEPLLDALARLGPDAPLVCELSSFQLHYLAAHPPRFAAAVFTSLARDHLDWHPDLAHYHATKLRLLEWADACAVADELRARIPDARLLPAVAYAHGTFLAADGQTLAVRDDLALLGEHNARNAALALAVALHLGVERTLIPLRLRGMRGLPHRLQVVHAVHGMTFIDDSIATTPESAMAGMAAIDGPLAVILGGSDKGAEFTELAAAVAARRALPVVIGQTAASIARALEVQGIVARRAANIDDAVAQAVAALPGGGSVLLSPACASFDMFQGFEDRGRQFSEAARRILR